VCQIGTRFKKSVNCIPTFEKVFQLGPYQTELINIVSQHVTCQYVVFLIFLIFLKFLKIKIKMPCVKCLCVTRGIVSATWHRNATCVTIRCNYVDFYLVPIYVFLFQFSI